jgi:hypothetical protein
VPSSLVPPDLSDGDAFIREVHQVEERINDFLSAGRREAEELLATARADAEAFLAQAEEEARREERRAAEELVVLARAEAAALEKAGRETAGRPDGESEPRRKKARALLLDLLLGRAR